MRWKKDGAQWVAQGSLAEYRITEWVSPVHGCGSFHVRAKLKGERSPKTIGDMSSLKNAQQWAEQYDGYRAIA